MTLKFHGFNYPTECLLSWWYFLSQTKNIEKQTNIFDHLCPDAMPSTLASPHVGPHHAGAFLVQHSFDEVDYLAAFMEVMVNWRLGLQRFPYEMGFLRWYSNKVMKCHKIFIDIPLRMEYQSIHDEVYHSSNMEGCFALVSQRELIKKILVNEKGVP